MPRGCLGRGVGRACGPCGGGAATVYLGGHALLRLALVHLPCGRVLRGLWPRTEREGVWGRFELVGYGMGAGEAALLARAYGLRRACWRGRRRGSWRCSRTGTAS